MSLEIGVPEMHDWGHPPRQFLGSCKREIKTIQHVLELLQANILKPMILLVG